MTSIALAVERAPNRRLLAECLEGRYQLMAAEGGSLPPAFDLCVVDVEGLLRFGPELEGRRRSEAPVFLPVLLLTPREEGDLVQRPGFEELAGERVDEILSMPAPRAELDLRVETLLRTRRQSLELKDRLLDAQRLEAVAVLAGGVVHDLNNLLTVIQTSASLLSEALETEGRPAEELATIRTAVERGAGLTRRLLSFARRKPRGSGRVDPGEVLSTTAKMLEANQSAEIEFIHRADPRTPEVRADPVRLEQVVMNLVVNAVEAMEGRGRIDLEARMAEPGELETAGDEGRGGRGGGARAGAEALPASPPPILLSVSDTGPGIEADVLERIFEPFFTTKESGTGLGLASAARIVAEMGGTITAESEVGRGTTFRILLPPFVGAAAEEGEEAPEPPAAKAGRGARSGTALGAQVPATDEERLSGTVLVVDDEEAIRSVATRILEGAGLSVLGAGTAGDAIGILQSRDTRVDVVLTDSILPGLSRSRLPQVLGGAAGRELGVVFMSGYERKEIEKKLGSLGEAPFLRKPFTPRELVEAVRSVLPASAA